MKYKDAHNSQPHKCVFCKGKLESIQYSEFPFSKFPWGRKDEGWWKNCICGAYYVWSHPNVWKAYHRLQLWDNTIEERIVA